MIGKLRGTVDTLGDDWVIVDVGGVGYQVHCSGRTLGEVPSVGNEVVFAIETHVRETEIKLYGFRTDLEREWFRLLQNVQGVGARVALAILSTLAPGDLASAIALQDRAAVARAPGVGPKVAGRIVSELKGKAPVAGGAVPTELAAFENAVGDGLAGSAVVDAVSALQNLGYSSQQAAAAVAAAVREAGDGADSARLIRLGLKELAN